MQLLSVGIPNVNPYGLLPSEKTLHNLSNLAIVITSIALSAILGSVVASLTTLPFAAVVISMTCLGALVGIASVAYNRWHSVSSCELLKNTISDHQAKMLQMATDLKCDEKLFEKKETQDNQLSISTLLQGIILPLYRQPLPQHAYYYDEKSATYKSLYSMPSFGYSHYLKKLADKTWVAKHSHGVMHATRVTLWTQLLKNLYIRLGREEIANPVLLAMSGAFHDVARETDSVDYWDTESSIVFEKCLQSHHIQSIDLYVQTIREKDPRNHIYSSDEQRIVHDADCLDIIRCLTFGKNSFKTKYLNFYQFDKSKQFYFDQLIDEIAHFIKISDVLEMRLQLEHHSQNIYADLVRLLYKKHQELNCYPIIIDLLGDEMQKILVQITTAS